MTVKRDSNRIRTLAAFASPALLILAVAVQIALLSSGTWPQEPFGTPGQEIAVERRGAVTVSELPPPSPEELARGPIPLLVPDPEALAQHKEQLRLKTLAAQAGATPNPIEVLTSLSIGPSFIGLQQPESCTLCEPPDTQIGAGPNDLFEAVNLKGRVFSKDGTAEKSFGLNSFFGLSATIFASDPRLRFDPSSQRWFVVMLSLNDSSLVKSDRRAMEPRGVGKQRSQGRVRSLPHRDREQLSRFSFSGNQRRQGRADRQCVLVLPQLQSRRLPRKRVRGLG